MSKAWMVVGALAMAACGNKMTNGGGGGGAAGGAGGGGAPSCAPPGMICSTGCVNTNSDPRNCGGCGRDCGTAPCNGGVCAPIKVLAAGDINARGPLVLDGSYLYFTTASPVCNVNATCQFVDKCLADGCADGFVVAEPGYAPIAVGGGTLYFKGAANVQSCATGSQCINSATTVASQSALALAVDGNGVYFLSGANVLKCPLGGCGGATPTTLATITGQPAPTLAADGTHVFYASETEILSVPDDASAAATSLVAGLTGVTTLTLDAGNVYYGTSSGELGSCAKSGCAQATRLTSTPRVQALATDGKEVFWSGTGHPTSLWRCPVAPPCTPKAIADEGTTGIFGIAVDDKFVYYTNGSIWKILR